jgi:hypothetical protein
MTSMTIAQEYSDDLVAAGIKHVNAKLADKAWMAEARSLSPVLRPNRVSWLVDGAGQLTEREVCRIREAFLNEGWLDISAQWYPLEASLINQDGKEPANWELLFVMAANEE